MKKAIPWVKIKKEYLEGVKPKIIAEKYNITSDSIRTKASKEKWKIEKDAICNKLPQKIEDRINGLTNKALDTCESVIDNPRAAYRDKLQAAKIIMDISGLKKEKRENINITPQIVVASQKDADILRRIADVNPDKDVL